MALKGAGMRAISRNMTNRENFRHGNVSGKWYDSWDDVPLGRLPMDVSALYGTKTAVYVVFSYGTPIAWRFVGTPPNEPGTDNGWRIPDIRYSVTTTNHQGVVRVCANNPGFYDDAKW